MNRPPPHTLCIGHRGAAGHAPENTLASIRAALELGADWIEIDVHLCEQEVVVIHDFTLERTTNGSGHVRTCSFDYLRSLNAGNGEQIPRLQEVLAILPEGIGINIELKGAATGEAVARILKHQNTCATRAVLVSSFDWPQLDCLYAGAPWLALAPLTKDDYDSAVRFADSICARCINVEHGRVTSSQVDDAHRRGLQIFVFTLNTATEFAHATEIGVDGIFTDYPDRLRHYLNHS